MRPGACVLAAVLFLAAGCACGEDDGGGVAPPPPTDGIYFADATAAAGLAGFVQENGEREKLFIVESIGAGVAFLDYDLDGDLDAYLSNGSSLEGFLEGAHPADALYAGDGEGGFRDVTAEVGLGDRHWTNGVRVADYNGDGWPDLMLTNYGPNVLYRNVRGHFSDVTAEAGVGDPRWSTGSCFLDHDKDGDLDLYVANYLHFDREWIEANQPRRKYRGVSVSYGPVGLPGAADIFYENTGGGRFADVSAAVGIADTKRFGFQSVAFDYDDDGWIDVYVANDSEPNLLWRNQGDRTFVDMAFRAGLAYNQQGLAQAGMGVALGDYDGDLLLDLYVTNFAEDYYTLYRNQGGGLFTDVTHRVKLGQATMSSLGWATALIDLDNDADVDLFMVNGHVFPQVDLFELGTKYRQRNQAFENVGNGFVAVESLGALEVVRCSRGAAFGDYDNDGDVDVLVGNLDAAPTLYRNDTRNQGNWIKLRLVGAGGNRDAIGARVYVTAGGREQVRAVGSAAGWLSSDDPRIHVGIGAAETVERVRVVWPDGSEEVVEDLPARRLVTIEEGRGAVAVKEL
ncbi:MAG: CRTAC1 family protein [Planctomycetota bacterium]|nr:CRTAC1 family protein [Planctomycetota bacterium]